MLISAQEAKMPESPFNERGAFPGPKMLLVSPDVNTAAKSPLRLRIKFETRGAKINLDSLKVTYIKLEPIDLTERVREFAAADGIDFKDAEIPPGTHKNSDRGEGHRWRCRRSRFHPQSREIASGR